MRLNIPKIEFLDNFPDLRDVSAKIETTGTKTSIDKVNWKSYPYKPEVVFFCGYTKNEILLKFRVVETHILACYTEINSPVSRDSCVEFFISSGNDYYYNFEFNCIATPLIGYGKERNNRIKLSEKIISTVRRYSTLGDKKLEVQKVSLPWEITMAIPFSLFKEPEYKDPSNHSFKANFYKCGDDLPTPHYLSWNPVTVKEPDFHRPEFFSDIHFIE